MDREEDRAPRCPTMTASEAHDELLLDEDEYELMYEWAELIIAPPPLLGD